MPRGSPSPTPAGPHHLPPSHRATSRAAGRNEPPVRVRQAPARRCPGSRCPPAGPRIARPVSAGESSAPCAPAARPGVGARSAGCREGARRFGLPDPGPAEPGRRRDPSASRSRRRADAPRTAPVWSAHHRAGARTETMQASCPRLARSCAAGSASRPITDGLTRCTVLTPARRSDSSSERLKSGASTPMKASGGFSLNRSDNRRRTGISSR